jgi:2-furoyl-CoA dehydrogenase FAD binding subunit
MKPRPFDYVRPDSVEEVLALLAEYGDDARILAGGQSLLPMLNLRLIDARVLIDISRLDELDVIRRVDDAKDDGAVEQLPPQEKSLPGGLRVIENPHFGEKVEVGAAVTQDKLMNWPQLKTKLPLLAAALPFVGHFQTRNRGTVCGSVAHADPSSEIPLVLATLNGEVVLRSQRGIRILRAGNFQKDVLTTTREPDELVVAVRFPVIRRQAVAFREVARRHGDFAIMAFAAVVTDTWVHLGIGGFAGIPVVPGFRIDGNGKFPDWFAEWVEQMEGYDDLHASAAMRRDLCRNLAPQVVREAMACVG